MLSLVSVDSSKGIFILVMLSIVAIIVFMFGCILCIINCSHYEHNYDNQFIDSQQTNNSLIKSSSITTNVWAS